MRETGDEKALQQPSGRQWGCEGGEKKPRRTLKTTETQVETALWEISLSTNKAQAGNHCLTSLAPGQGDCSVNKLAVALTAWKLILTP